MNHRSPALAPRVFRLFRILLLLLFLPANCSPARAASGPGQPLALHPDNPHYFLFRARPTVLITSGEHYGAVLNRDFDYRKYLDTLARDGLNLTRTFSGAYAEPAGSFNITSNTLAPGPGRLLAPWARAAEPGYAGGGNKFDLNQWDEAYFARLKEFVGYAAKRGVVVELNLFCPMYEEAQWRLSPQNAANNVNRVGDVSRTNIYTLDRNGGLLAFQHGLVRKIVTELNSFDNVYYEICNEPYFGGVTLDWQRSVADVIVDTEKSLPRRHLISQNIANNKARVTDPDPAVSIFNFHYAAPPDTVRMNYGLNKVIGDNETGFCGTNDLPYRVEAWGFLLSGGGLFNHLDYSFTVGHEDGTFVYPAKQPGGGNAVFRRQMKVLRDFMRGLDFIHMKPLNPPLNGSPPAGTRAFGLADPGRSYAIYLTRDKPGAAAATDAVVSLPLPAGRYRVEWTHPATGRVDKAAPVQSDGGAVALPAPAFREDIALRVTAR